MRRMIDPKELNQGGGQAKTYQHFIELDIKSSQIDSNATLYFNINNSDPTPFTTETITIEYLKNHPTAVSGNYYMNFSGNMVPDRYAIVYAIVTLDGKMCLKSANIKSFEEGSTTYIGFTRTNNTLFDRITSVKDTVSIL